MGSKHRIGLGVVAALAVALLAAACTGDGAPDVEAPPGSRAYTYAGAGIEATLSLEGRVGTLEVTNGTDGELGPPHVYAIHATTGVRTEGRVTPAEPVPPGETASFSVQFPRRFDPSLVGFVGLEMGGADYGGFIPAAAQ